ncbi:MBL fold metallo-hydrolase [Aspergillus glaucus CBS 516.65]|uniref:Metallo-beta-lactamase domain-containing protein n=1 Tax=Aspergillus glaucus CBS 516.65 TaxID=1160497 RepID=A0A1L9VBM1_ASPGL|nr:hypothetical protein ASPGLDRAFT_50362 [Aspergillus glaucus CBS 516.65]OJJ81314.1 hypothetical protein ASPGLDRAFT_50362 [Aspergillus glaucus CBS 516.65]
MMEFPPFQVPPGQEITVKLINPVNFGPAQLHRFMGPPVPGMETHPSNPSFSFLLEHPSGRKVVFDLGIRKDYLNYAPKIAEYIPTTKYKIEVTKNVVDILEEDGIKAGDVEAVIWSHWHWDHIGDPSTFPLSTDLIVGPGFKIAMLPGAPTNPDSPLSESDYSGRNLREITFEGPNCLTIGRFQAFDYFNDGSFYLLDSPGHAIGHLCGLARTTTSPDTFIFLGGDICHYGGIFRPSKYLPVPEPIHPHPCNPDSKVAFCPGGAFEELQQSRGRSVTDPLFTPTFGHDIPLIIETIGKLQEADCREDVFVIIAHDATVRDAVDHFPRSLNSWMERGWAKDVKWAFLKDAEVYWKSNGVI